jgi:hypothetical protein
VTNAAVSSMSKATRPSANKRLAPTDFTIQAPGASRGFCVGRTSGATPGCPMRWPTTFDAPTTQTGGLGISCLVGWASRPCVTSLRARCPGHQRSGFREGYLLWGAGSDFVRTWRDLWRLWVDRGRSWGDIALVLYRAGAERSGIMRLETIIGRQNITSWRQNIVSWRQNIVSCRQNIVSGWQNIVSGRPITLSHRQNIASVRPFAISGR